MHVRHHVSPFNETLYDQLKTSKLYFSVFSFRYHRFDNKTVLGDGRAVRVRHVLQFE